MKIHLTTLFLFLPIFFSTLAFAKKEKLDLAAKVEAEWMARAKTAHVRSEENFKSRKVNKIQAIVNVQEACEMMVEMAFAMHRDPETATTLRKNAIGMKGYSLLIYALDGKTWTQLALLYPENGTHLIGISVHKLAEKWAVVATDENAVIVEGDQCRITFDFKTPLSPKVVAIQKNK